MMAGPNDKASLDALEIGSAVVREMLRKVKFAVSTDGTRKSITGVNIALKDGLLGMTATDGRRLAHVEKEFDAGAEARHADFNFTLPMKAVGTLYALLEKMEEADLVTIASDGRGSR